MPCISLIVASSGTSAFPAFSVSRGMRPVTEGRRLMLRITQPRCGSNATLPQFVPPITPGYWIVPARLEGVKDAVVAIALDQFLALARSQGLSPKRHRY